MRNVVVRPLRIPAELDAVCALYAELAAQHLPANSHAHPDPNADAPVDEVPPLRDQVAALADEPAAALLVAVTGERIVGFVSGNVADPPSGGLERYSGPVLHVADLLVTSQYRRHGLGVQLMDELEQWGHSRGATSVILHVAAENEGATRFYDQQGFHPVWVKMRKDFPTIGLRPGTADDQPDVAPEQHS